MFVPSCRGTAVLGGGLLRVDEHRQRLVVDLDERQDVFGLVAVAGDDHRDGLADIAHNIAVARIGCTKGRVVASKSSVVPGVRHVGARRRRLTTAIVRGSAAALRRRSIRHECRACAKEAAEHGGLHHALELDVGDEAPLPAEQPLVLSPENALAERGVVARWHGSPSYHAFQAWRKHFG